MGKYKHHVFLSCNFLLCELNDICGVMVSILASSMVDRGLEPWSGLAKTIKLASLPPVW